MKRTPIVLLAAVALVGCGGGGGGAAATPSDSTPKGAVQAFVADVGKGDWKGACALVDPLGQVDLVAIIHADFNAELDSFGQLSDCPASFAKHAALLQAAVKGADPAGTAQQKGAAHAVIGSPKGDWRTVLAQKPATGWRIAGVPRTN